MDSIEHLIPRISRKWTACVSGILGAAIGFVLGFAAGINYVVDRGMEYLNITIDKTILMQCVKYVGLHSAT